VPNSSNSSVTRVASLSVSQIAAKSDASSM
jgi:hypothetical protein